MTTTLTIIVIIAMLWLAWPKPPKAIPPKVVRYTLYDSDDSTCEQQYAYIFTPHGTKEIPIKWQISGPQPRIKIERIQ